MAASSNRADCTHPNAPVESVKEGGWPVRELDFGGTSAGGVSPTVATQNKIIKTCPDCGQVLQEGLKGSLEIDSVTLSAGAVGGTSPTATVTLTWTSAGDDTDSYKIERSLDGGTTWVASTPATALGTATTSPQTGLNTGSRKFRVFAIQDGVQGPSSNVATITVP